MSRKLGFFLWLLVCVAPEWAFAQYKNTSFGLDGGYWLISKPTVLNKSGEVLDRDQRPVRLRNGFRFGGETNFKMDADHWWFNGQVHMAFLRHSYQSGTLSGRDKTENDYDRQANKSLGTLFALQAGLGVRYVFLTDRFRPYLQGGLTFTRLFTFAEAAAEPCGASFCGANGTNADEFLPHRNLGGINLTPGAEIIVTRDIALHLFVNLDHWFVYNAADNNAIAGGLGILFFT